MNVKAGVSLVALVVAGCTMQAPYVRPPVTVPKTWHTVQEVPGAQPVWPSRDWWGAFGDTTLNELEERALANNHDLKAAVSRIAQAKAAAQIVDANLYPTVDAKFEGERKSALSGANAVNAFITNLSAGYQLDVWGGLRSARQAAQADVLAASQAGANVALVLTSDVAGSYLQLALLGQRIDLAHQQVATAHGIASIMETRYRAGAVSELDAALANTSLVSIEASVPTLEQSRQETLNTLAILVGDPPFELAVGLTPLTRLEVPAAVPVGMPSELLERRPDIRQAEANLMALHADIGAARALLFPSIVLTGQGGYASDQLSTLVRSSNGIRTLGGSLLAPIFHGGSLRANVERSTERYNELLQQYQQTILGALRDVENALVDLRELRDQETLLKEAEREGERAFKLAEIRYRAGATDAITMLNAQNTWLNLQVSVLQTHFARLTAVVSLIKALGGGGQA